MTPPPPHPHLKKLIWRLKIIQVVNLKTKNDVLVWIGGSPLIKTTCPVEMAHSAVIESVIESALLASIWLNQKMTIFNKTSVI